MYVLRRGGQIEEKKHLTLMLKEYTYTFFFFGIRKHRNWDCSDVWMIGFPGGFV